MISSFEFDDCKNASVAPSKSEEEATAGGKCQTLKVLFRNMCGLTISD